MRRLSLLFLAFLPLPALAAVPTVTITRTLSAPDGTRPATGTIRATLGPAVGVYLDGQTTVAVSGSATGAIVSGVATITLTPTDVLSPAGLLYAVTIASDKPRLSWSETWQVASSGAVTRLSVAPGITVPPVVTYGLDAALNGKPCAVPAVASDTGRIYGCVGGVYSASSLYTSATVPAPGPAWLGRSILVHDSGQPMQELICLLAADGSYTWCLRASAAPSL
jgi:hypothetical protein